MFLLISYKQFLKKQFVFGNEYVLNRVKNKKVFGIEEIVHHLFP